MEAEKQSTALTSASAATKKSKFQPQPWSKFVKELTSKSNEEKLLLFEKNYRHMYDVYSSTSKEIEDMKAASIKKVQDKSTQMKTTATDDLYFKLQSAKQDLAQVFQQLELRKKVLQASKEQVQSRIKAIELQTKKMDLMKAKAIGNEKRVSELQREIDIWKNKCEIKLTAVTKHTAIQIRQHKLTMQIVELNLKRLKSRSNQMEGIILKVLSLTAPDDEANKPKRSKTKKEKETEILRRQLTRMLNELSKLNPPTATSLSKE